MPATARTVPRAWASARAERTFWWLNTSSTASASGAISATSSPRQRAISPSRASAGARAGAVSTPHST